MVTNPVLVALRVKRAGGTISLSASLAGQVIPPGRLAVGAPARVIGEVSGDHREAIARGAAHYAELARSYLERGFARAHPFAAADTGIRLRVTTAVGTPAKPVRIDGRRQRSERTRQTIIEAYLALLRESPHIPTAAQIARIPNVIHPVVCPERWPM